MAFPLAWPVSQKRAQQRVRGAFKEPSMDTVTCDLVREMRLLEGRDLVISTNVQLRIDGWPRSGMKRPDDPGAAVYFSRKKKPLVFACDRYVSPELNLRAILLHLEALRGMERWGVGSLDQAFAGYAALPESTGTDLAPWWQSLGLPGRTTDIVVLTKAFRTMAKVAHPDTGGSTEEFLRLKEAYQRGMDEAAHG